MLIRLVLGETGYSFTEESLEGLHQGSSHFFEHLCEFTTLGVLWAKGLPGASIISSHCMASGLRSGLSEKTSG